MVALFKQDYNTILLAAKEQLEIEKSNHNANPGLSIIKGIIFLSVPNGVQIYYPDGVKRLIKNSFLQ